MVVMRDTQKRYRFIRRTGRNIEVVFAHIPAKYYSTGTKDIAEAFRFAEAFLENEGINKKTIPLLKDFAKDFFTRDDKNSIKERDKAFGRSKRPQWYVTSQEYLDNYIIPRFGSYPVDSIQPVAIENWIVTFKGKKAAELSGGTRVKVLNCFRDLMDDVVRMGYRTDNPARAITSPSDRPVKERRALSIYEQQILFPESSSERVDVFGSPMWATYFSIMYDTGFRPNEVAGLRVCDVYQTPQGMAVYTTHTMNTEEHKPKDRVKTSGKGMESRVGLISAVTEELVIRLIEEDKISDDEEFLFLVDRKIKDSYVFADTSNKHFKTVCSRNNISGVTQYSIRHTYATYRRGDVDEMTLAFAMGHSNGVRDNYDHRTASIMIRQLERSRSKLFGERKDEEIQPLRGLLAK